MIQVPITPSGNYKDTNSSPVTIKMNKWKDGLEKVSLSMLQVQLLSLSLSDAKNNVDDLLIGKEVIIKNVEKEKALKFVDKALKIGVAECEIMD